MPKTSVDSWFEWNRNQKSLSFGEDRLKSDRLEQPDAGWGGYESEVQT